MAKPRSSTVVFASIDPSRLKSMSDEAASSRACVAARRSMHPRPQAGQAEAERRGVAEERPWRETTALSELWPRPVPAGATPRRPGCGGDAVGGPPSSQAVSLDPTSCVRLIRSRAPSRSRDLGGDHGATGPVRSTSAAQVWPPRGVRRQPCGCGHRACRRRARDAYARCAAKAGGASRSPRSSCRRGPSRGPPLRGR